MFQKATQYLSMFGEMLGDIEAGKQNLKHISPEDLDAYERGKQYRFNDLGGIVAFFATMLTDKIPTKFSCLVFEFLKYS